MKAIICEQLGAAENLKLCEIDIPKPNENQVLVAIKAVGINYRDSLIIEDKYQFKAPRPFSPCGEIAGEIVGIGNNVTNFKLGDRVCGEITYGGLAQYCVADAKMLGRIDDNVDFQTAAAMIVTYGTSLYALLQKGRLQKGENLLVLGASGGVGISALQIGKAMGAIVYAAVSSEDKAKIARENGADYVIIYPSGEFDTEGKNQLKQLFKTNAPNGGFNVIYDAIGGDYTEAALRAIAWNGRFLVVGFPAGIPKLPLNLSLVKGCDICGIFYTEFAAREIDEHRKNLEILSKMLADGLIKPIISATYNLENAIDAILALKNRQSIGKLLVTID
jgi:NADPH:quinone reductase